MNLVLLIGRLTHDPRIFENSNGIVAKYTLAVDRGYKKEGTEQTADFISCVAYGKTADFAQKYLTKGKKIAIEGRIQTGSYEKEGRKVYTTDVIVDRHEFVESKAFKENNNNDVPEQPSVSGEGFTSVPDDISDLPFG